MAEKGQVPEILMVQPSESTPDGLTRNLADVLDMLAAKYCPRCGTRRRLNETLCPADGTPLRDLSICTDGPWETSDLFSSNGGSLSRLLEDFQGGRGVQPPEDRDIDITGTILGGKWRVVKLCASGTFGAFFLGRHLTLGMQVGIKVLRKRFTRTESGRRLFHNEAMRLSMLHHPGIVQVLDYGEEDGRPYLVMEYLNGKPLHRYLGDSTFRIEDCVEVIRQAAEALGAAHRGVGIGEPLVHLDLKPEHIFLEKLQGRWHVKIIDFGIAEIGSAPLDPAGDEGVAERRSPPAGTLPYMAPERWDGVVDPRSDLYSLGVVLYELLTDKKPFQVPTPEALRTLHSEASPRPPSQHPQRSREVGLKELDALVLKLLDKDPCRRLETAEELALALEGWQKRPRRTPLQRLARVCILPALTTLLAMGLVAWGPWEGIALTSRPHLLVGKTPAHLEGVVRGLGYDAAELSLVVHGMPDDIMIPLGRVGKDGVISVNLGLEGPALETLPEGSQLIEKWKSLSGESELDVSLVATGWLGRRVKLSGLTLRIDDAAPKLVQINGKLPPEPGRSLGLNRRGDGEVWLELVANEPLIWRECTLNNEVRPRPLTTAEEGTTSVLFRLSEEVERLTVVLLDLAGNDATMTLPVSWRRQAPRMISLADRLTSDREARVSLEWSEDPGEVTVTIAGSSSSEQQVPTTARDGRWQADAQVSFACDAAGLQTRTLIVRVKPPGDVEPLEEQFSVHFLSRTLSAQRSSSNSREGLPVLVATSGEGQPLDEADLTWELRVEWRGGAGRSDFWSETQRCSELVVDSGLHLHSKRGKFRVLARARDRYGNVSPVLKLPIAFGVEPPLVRELKLTDQKVIHNRDCLLARVQDRITVEFAVEYPYELEGLRPEMRLGEDFSTGQIVVFEPVEWGSGGGRLSLSAARLREILSDNKTNRLLLRLTDPETDLWAEEGCSVDYELPPAFDVNPKEGEPIATGELPLEITPRGPAAASVSVKASGKDVPRAGQDGKFLVQLKVAGVTPVEVDVRFKNGCRKQATYRYCVQPRKGWEYTLPAGPRQPKLQLRYGGGVLWHTTPQLRATADEVEELCHRQREALKEALLPLGVDLKEVELRLPTLDELEDLVPGIRVTEEARSWWIRPEGSGPRDKTPEGFHLSAEWNGMGFQLSREPAQTRLQCFLVVRLPPEVCKRLPGLSTGVKAAKGDSR